MSSSIPTPIKRECRSQTRSRLACRPGLAKVLTEVQKDHTLVLRHEHDGRDLDLDYAHNVCDHILDLWGDDFKFFTIIEDEPFEI